MKKCFIERCPVPPRTHERGFGLAGLVLGIRGFAFFIFQDFGVGRPWLTSVASLFRPGSLGDAYGLKSTLRLRVRVRQCENSARGQIPKPEPPNPKPQTLNPKPQTPNPEP